MTIPRNTTTLLIAGTLAGLLSGILHPIAFGFKGALFGLCLTLVVLMIARRGWNFFVLIPGLLLGIGLGFIPTDSMEIFSPPSGFNYWTAMNCFLFIPAFAFAYQRKRIGLIFLFGLLSAFLRTESLGGGIEGVLFSYPLGTVPFILLWWGAMRLTDPRYLQKIPPESLAEEKIQTKVSL